MFVTPDSQIQEQLQSIVDSAPVVLFMKGNRDQPQCGFSARVVQILDRVLPDYRTVDVLADMEVREGIKVFSDWPTIPQLYVAGEFQGGCDVVTEMYGNGELHEVLGISPPPAAPPEITITDAAREALTEAAAQQDGELHLGIDALYRNMLFFGPADGSEVAAENNGVRVLLDRDSAVRAAGLLLDVQDTPQGMALRIQNPNAPDLSVPQLKVAELEAWRREGRAHRLIDVRTEEEHATASIAGAELISEAVLRELEALPRDATLVFHCHKGARSQALAERFKQRGFSDIHNLSGGIDAWAREVDHDVPTY